MAPVMDAAKSRVASVRGEAPAGSLLMVSLDEELNSRLMMFPLGGGMPRPGELKLDGSVSRKVVRETLKELGWRAQKGNPCYVVIPSEDVLLMIEEFPSRNSEEVRIMAEGLQHGMGELDPEQHVLLLHEMSLTENGTICAIAVFEKDRLQRIFECLQRLGVNQPRFVLDVMGLWQISDDVVMNGFWGRVVKSDGSQEVVVKGLKIEGGVIRGARQRLYFRELVTHEWLSTLAPQLFPEDFQTEGGEGMTWYVSQRTTESPTHLAGMAKLAASQKLIHFQAQPGFWKEHLKQQNVRRRWVLMGIMAAVCYLLFLGFLGGRHLWQWYEIRNMKASLAQNETAWKEAKEINRMLQEVIISRKSTGNPLEILRQVAEARPESIILESYSYRLRESVKLRGSAPDGQPVYDFVEALKNLPGFQGARYDQINPAAQGVAWSITIPMQGGGTP